MAERRELLQAALAYREKENYKLAAIALTRVINNSTELELKGFSGQVEQRLKMPLVELAAETRMRAAHAESRGRAIRLRYVTRYEKPALVPRLVQSYQDALLKEVSARPDPRGPSAPQATTSRPARTNTEPASSGKTKAPSKEAAPQPVRTYRINDWLDRPKEFDGNRAESEAFAGHIRYTISVLKARIQFDSQLRTNRAMRDALRREKVQLADLLEAVVARAGGALTAQERAERRLELRRMQEEYLKELQRDMEARQEQIRQAQKDAGIEIKTYRFSSEPQPIEEDVSNQATPPNPEKE